MAAPIVLGNSALVEVADSIGGDITSAGDTRTRTLKCAPSAFASALSTLKSAIDQPWPSEPSLVLSRVSHSMRSGMHYFVLTYSRPESGTSPAPPIGSVRFQVDANAVGVPIEQNPGYSPSLTAEGGDWEGITSYLSPQPTVTREETKSRSAFTLSESSIIASVGKRKVPPGVSGASAGKWLQTGRSIQIDSERVTLADTYQYAENDWLASIYAAA
jgi:hypothetical protein